MARRIRLDFPGAIHHAYARGNGRAPIFLDDADRLAFLHLLEQAVSKYGWRLHAFCLMPNHFHLCVETPEPTLSVGMKHLNGIYTQWFNARHERVGHLFQGRFKSQVVERAAYFRELIRYIVLNPVRAGLVRAAVDWRWSSYRSAIGDSAAAPYGMAPEIVYNEFGGPLGFAEFVAAAPDGSGKYDALFRAGGEVVGSQNFVEEVVGRRVSSSGQKKLEAMLARLQAEATRPTLREIFAHIRSARARRQKLPEAVAAAIQKHGYKAAEVAAFLGLSRARVTQIIFKVDADFKLKT